MSALESAYVSQLRRNGLRGVAALTSSLVNRGHGSQVLRSLALHLLDSAPPPVPEPDEADRTRFTSYIRKRALDVFEALPVLGKDYCPADLIEAAELLWVARCEEVRVHVSSTLGSGADLEEMNQRCAVASQELVRLLEAVSKQDLTGFFDTPHNKMELTSGQLESFLVSATRVVYEALDNPNAVIRRRHGLD